MEKNCSSLSLHNSSMEKEAKLISNGKIVTQVEHHGVQQLGKRAGREKTATMWDCQSCNVRVPHYIAGSLPPWLHPTRSLRDRPTHTWTGFTWPRFTVVKFFGTRRLAAVGNPTKKGEKGHLRTDSVCSGFVSVVSGGLEADKKKSRNFIAEAS